MRCDRIFPFRKQTLGNYVIMRERERYIETEKERERQRKRERDLI